jgi:hypothetical protein
MGATTAAAKSSQTTRKSARKTESQSPSVSDEQRSQMIEEAAYFRAEARDFEGGDPVADWLLSEQEIDDLLSQTPH